jgi:hypothetical protein
MRQTKHQCSRWLLEHVSTGMIICVRDRWSDMRVELTRRELPEIERPRGESLVGPHYRVRRVSTRLVGE